MSLLRDNCGFSMEQTRPRVLVIDPDPSVRALLAAVTRRRGFDSDTAATPEEALQHARSRSYAAVILEPQIAGGDALLSELAGENLIVATTSTDPCGVHAAAVLRKPFFLDELSTLIEGHLPASA